MGPALRLWHPAHRLSNPGRAERPPILDCLAECLASADTEPVESKVTDVRHYWQLDPAVREALPTEWMKTAYDRWKAKNHAGTDEQDISAGWVIETQKRLREQAEEEAV